MRPLCPKLLPLLIAACHAAPAFAEDNASLTPSMEIVLIEAQRTPASVARAAQQEASNLINLMTVEEMRKLPDVNIAESVRRIPGVSLETDTGEGRYVNVRGLDADLNSTTFGGLRLPPSNNASPFGGGRAVALDAIPTGLVGAITVTKTTLPEQDAEALGGTIEITPKTAPRGAALFGEARIGGGTERLRHSGITDLSFSGGGRFGPGNDSADKPFSVVLTGAYYEDKRGVDDVEPGFIDDGVASPYAYAGWDLRHYQYNRKRHGVGIDFGYQPSAASRYYLRAFDAGYTETVLRNRLIVTPDGAPAQAGGQFIDGLSVNGFDKTLRDEKERINNRVLVIGGRNAADQTVLDYRVGYTRGSFVKLYDYNSDFNFTPAAGAPLTIGGTIVTPPTVSYDHSGKGSTPVFSVAGANPLDPANYQLVKFQNSTTDIQDKERSAAANLAMAVGWGGFDTESVKLGLSARLRTRNAAGQPYSYSALPALGLGAASTGNDVTFYDGQYHNGPNITPGSLQTLLAGHDGISKSDRINAALQFQHDQEDVYAAYGQYEMKRGALGVIAGARVESTRARYDANAKGVDATGATFTAPVSGGRDYTNWFPSIQLRYALDKDSVLRAAWSTAIARPGFNQVSPSLNVNVGAGSVSQGNPDLKPTTANAFDLSYELYLPHAGIASVGVFDKELKDYIANRVANQTFPNDGLFAGFTGVAHVHSFVNLDKAHARGLELNLEQRFKELPGFWSGLGAGLNYTYVASAFDIRPGERAMLPSTSRHTANASVFYERRGINLRLGAYYLTRNLFAIGGDSGTDVYSEPRFSLDLGSSYAINDSMSLYLNAKNLTNTALKFAEGQSDRTIQREFYGATYQFGVTFNF